MAAVLAAGLDATAAYAGPKFAALTVDARNGKVLYASDIDGIRHPASLTKMMTLYLLFEDMSAGTLKLSSPITVSARCTGMAPSKLGVKAGGSITAETAMRALIVKSANDIACAVAETLGGSESAFAQRMTRTARSLGMSRTTFLNASGLPNPNQVTSARDMATLGLRLMRDHPQYYPYFNTRSFVFQGKTIKGHNRLLGSYEGADGIKTGYVAASGFNLVTSVRRGDKRLVGVVIGGKSGASRDAYMKQMLSQYFDDATGGQTIAAYAGSAKGAKPTDETETAAAGDTGATPAAKPPRKDAAAKRLAQRKNKAAQAKAAGTGAGEPAEQGDTEDGVDQMASLAAQAARPAKPAAAPVATGTATKAAEEAPQVETVPPPIPNGTVADAPSTAPSEQKTQAQQQADQARMATIAAGADGGWIISLGDYATKADATAVLQQMRKRSPDMLDGRTAQTVMVEKKGKITYRARFTGFDQASAAMACKTIKKQKAPCQPVGPS
ncbi:D-alanyl-D-alanine carboxypeptidase [Aestuariivirga sp.]|uniref:D-alanyl-D-alanine carboxypeptidase n=1 Tax=Aestuariivirga sp. TaxID=2650926 RepID=UPI0025B9E766|nr:D-alanyl-D-alanine carboxypeptidase [Aestuariivirga sp.]MCA3556038.1 D-alanyl-D-alanine carboxypeptidase [Aestuariivirga sp.]